jgi:hypothetical protein
MEKTYAEYPADVKGKTKIQFGFVESRTLRLQEPGRASNLKAVFAT